MISYALVPVSNNALVDFFNKKIPQIDQFLIKEFNFALCSSNPLSKALGKDGPLATAFNQRQYYKNHLSIVDPVQYKPTNRLKKVINMSLC